MIKTVPPEDATEKLTQIAEYFADAKLHDMEQTIKEWRNAGGVGILHTSAANTIKELKKLGL